MRLPGRRCSTATCASGPGGPASRSCRSTPCATTTPTWTAGRGRTAPDRSWRPGASSSPRAARVTRLAPRPSAASVRARTRSCCAGSARTASPPIPARCATSAPPRGPGGAVAERDKLRGKPAPDTFLAGARALGLEPPAAAVFEDALAGVAAGRAGGFGFVVGVDRAGQAEALAAHGADVVVKDLADLLAEGRPEP